MRTSVSVFGMAYVGSVIAACFAHVGYNEEIIPHIGSLLSSELAPVVQSGEVVVIATKIDKTQLAGCLRREQLVIDPVNLAAMRARRLTGASYQGLCW